MCGVVGNTVIVKGSIVSAFDRVLFNPAAFDFSSRKRTRSLRVQRVVLFRFFQRKHTFSFVSCSFGSVDSCNSNLKNSSAICGIVFVLIMFSAISLWRVGANCSNVL